ncbi:ArsR/SmtB family transcription factor [Nucisporomicrobium flavum]|jgi:ArsR family transcriptional regulator, arsenate/arsenite/antimonite-responsive transcriptional repressor|uniref:ArsR/SmtB family transcription factor n=1 Tax=Nucisporomicrobium flavum TaxID=2785915 RepID=UPI0018F5B0B9|nr:metalloregulator ArsR/SmtB family transcription factor [Nucisporomicrobium flavum]
MSVLPVLETTAAQACCPPLSAQALEPQVAGELAPLFKALSDPIRLRLLSLIAASDEVCVCDLTDAFDVTGATISHHLRVLREAGMVEARRVGTWAYYRLRADALDLLGGLLSTDAAAMPRLPAPAATALPSIDHDRRDTLISAEPDVVRLLGDPLRAQIVQILAAGPATTSHLVADTGAKQPNISGHLKLLREAGVVTPESRGRYTYYRVVPDALQGAALHLADLAEQAEATADDFRAL